MKIRDNAGKRRRVEAEGFVSLMRYIYAEDRDRSKFWPMRDMGV